MKIYTDFDYAEVVEKINGLEGKAKDCFVKKGNNIELNYEVFYMMAVIDKSIKLFDSALFALEKKNITVLAILTRVQMDCVFRAYALSLVDNRNLFAKQILIDKKQINFFQSMEGKTLTDKYLAHKVEEWLKLPIYDLYKKVCGFVHFSDYNFYSMISSLEQGKITMLSMSRENPLEKESEFERLSLELANQFLFFGDILINCILDSWVDQCQNAIENQKK